MARSMLFVPGDSGRKFERAAAGSADALILDLEDSVAPDRKTEARETVREMLRQAPQGKQLWVRVNALDTGHTLADLAAVIGLRPAGIVMPKCRGADDLRRLAHYIDAFEAAAGVEAGSVRILVIATEVAEGVFGLGGYRGVTPRLVGLSWGAEDLASDIGALENRSAGTYTDTFKLARSLCLMGAAAAGVAAIDTVCVDLEDPVVLEDETRAARRDGFAGKMAIHPKHVDPINRIFTADEAQLEWANKVVAAFEANPQSGTLRLDGKMIDLPHLRLARRLLAGA